MNAKTAVLVLTLVLPLGVSAQTIPNTTYSALQPVVVSGASTITTSTNTVVVSNGATVTYQASTSVTLGPGFHAYTGSNFYAMIGSTVDTDGDGLPDAWERAHGLNPSSAGDANNTTSSGLTYLLKYQLSTRTTTSKQTDTGNTNGLKIHRPVAP